MNFDEPPLTMANYNGVLELRSRLPHVPETVIAHFLSKVSQKHVEFITMCS